MPPALCSCSGTWPLAPHLTGDNEVETVFLDPLPGLADHEHLAVEAGIEVGAIPMFGVEQHLFVFLDHIDDVQLDVELFRHPHPKGVVALGLAKLPGADGVRMAFDAETGKEQGHRAPLAAGVVAQKHASVPAGLQALGNDPIDVKVWNVVQNPLINFLENSFLCQCALNMKHFACRIRVKKNSICDFTVNNTGNYASG